jgi:hypothetical protein
MFVFLGPLAQSAKLIAAKGAMELTFRVCYVARLQRALPTRTSMALIPIKNQIALIIHGQQNIWDTFLAIANVPCASLPSSCSTFSTTPSRFSK